MLKDSDMMADHKKLLEEIRHLVKSPRQRADMADRLSKEARSDAAKRLADIILEEA
jgi:UDP-N-acetylglucosamine:LPS N-acetylglucosamine transferase